MTNSAAATLKWHFLDNICNSDHNVLVQKRPEQWLEEVAPEKKQGIFKLFLGYAPGVGKTYSMLSEGIRRYSRGEDVVIGVVETHGRKGVASPH
jgi:two-component system sensor histidine kinase KdpD